MESKLILTNFKTLCVTLHVAFLFRQVLRWTLRKTSKYYQEVLKENKFSRYVSIENGELININKFLKPSHGHLMGERTKLE